jgi:hypothetical protein
MEPDITAQLKELDAKISLVYESVEKTRKYFLVIIWVTVITLVLPAIGLIFAIPTFLSMYAGLGGL